MAALPADLRRPDPETRTRRFLADEPVIWLSTVREDGLPHLVPVWFWWDGSAITVWSKPHAVKVQALRANPRAMVALGEPDDDFDVAMVEVRAELLDATPVPAAFFAKYGGKLASGELDETTFRATYTQAIRLTPTRWLAWHGRSPRERRDAAPAVVTTRRVRPSFREALGRLSLPPAVSY